jgi:YD repeat-containing protein
VLVRFAAETPDLLPNRGNITETDLPEQQRWRLRYNSAAEKGSKQYNYNRQCHTGGPLSVSFACSTHSITMRSSSPLSVVLFLLLCCALLATAR